jgi:hypothetical protein
LARVCLIVFLLDLDGDAVGAACSVQLVDVKLETVMPGRAEKSLRPGYRTGKADGDVLAEAGAAINAALMASEAMNFIVFPLFGSDRFRQAVPVSSR